MAVESKVRMENQRSSPQAQKGRTPEDLDHLFATERGRLTAYGLGLGFDEEESREAVQEAFLRLHRTVNSGAEVRHPGAYLYRIVRNILFDRARIQKKLEALTGHEESAAMDLDHTASDLLALLESLLTEREREVFRLRRQGASYAEIAASLGIARGTVGALLARGMGKMRAQTALRRL